MGRSKAVLLVVFLLAGCFPIELDVSKDGRILIPREEGFFALDPAKGTVVRLHVPAGGEPVFARFSPDGKQILAVTEGGGGSSLSFGSGSSGGHIFTVVTPADGTSRVIFTGTNATYACFSPDGQYISLTRMASQKKEPLDEALPELHLVNLKDAEKKLLAANVGDLQRWFPDSKALLAFQIQEKNKDDKLYRGTLSAIDIASGEGKPLASVAGAKGVFFDLSPDGKTVLFTARAAGKVGEELKPEDKARLFELKIPEGTVRPAAENVKYAIWSPNGQRVLLGTDEKSGFVTLKVGDAGLAALQDVATKAAVQVDAGMGPSTSIYPGWVGNDTVLYLTRKAVYGKAGENLALMTVGVDGKNPRNHQALIDLAAIKSAK